MHSNLTIPLAAMLGLAVALSACSSPPPSTLVQARGDMNTAASAPADTYSRPELDEARQKLSQAEGAARQNDMADADRYAQEALADLQLSKARADDEKAQTAASEIQTTVAPSKP